MSKPELKVGQIWIEVDPRSTLPVEIIHIGEPYQRPFRIGGLEFEMCRTVTLLRGNAGGKQTKARSTRFNGKHGGYKLVKDVP